MEPAAAAAVGLDTNVTGSLYTYYVQIILCPTLSLTTGDKLWFFKKSAKAVFAAASQPPRGSP